MSVLCLSFAQLIYLDASLGKSHGIVGFGKGFHCECFLSIIALYYGSYYETRSVLIALAITVAVCVAISIFAIQVRVSSIYIDITHNVRA